MFVFSCIRFTDIIAGRLKDEIPQHPELSSLFSKLPEVLLQSKAKNTSKKYQGGFKAWSKWANRFGLVSLPAKDIEFALYLVHLIQSSNSPACIDGVLLCKVGSRPGRNFR